MQSFTKMSTSDPAVSLTPWNTDFLNNYLDFLSECEALCETALAPESGPLGGLFDEKNPRVENLVTLSLNVFRSSQ
jgi:hypothetical protein